MTAQSSSKSFFKTYLVYKLGTLKMFFIMCCILNALALPLYAASAHDGFGGVVSDFAPFGRVFSTMCIIAIIVIAMAGAAQSFDHYNKKDLTDTIGVLPLSYRERFFADFLAGYIVNILPIIPCGIVCAVMFGALQGKFDERYGTEFAGNFKMAGLGIMIAVTLLIIVSFAYLFSVLITSCCGKLFHSVIFTVFGTAALPLFFAGVTGCFIDGIVGLDTQEHFAKAAAFFPPLGLLGELFGAMGLVFKSDTDYSIPVKERYSIFDPIHIVVYVILAAGILAAAYFIGKHRRAENTGMAFTVKPMFTVISAVTAAGVTGAMIFLNYQKFWFYLAFAAAAGLVSLIVTIVLYLPKKKELLRSAVIGAAAVGLMVLTSVLFDKTGSFGARYFSTNASKIEYVKIDDTFIITDKADIEKYLSLLNDKLRKYSSDMFYDTSGYIVEIKTESGKTIKRHYCNDRSDSRWSTRFKKYIEITPPRLEKLLFELDGYADYFFDGLESLGENMECKIYTNNSEVSLSPSETKRFVEVLREELSEKPGTGAVFGEAEFSSGTIYYRKASDVYFEITNDLSDTIMFLESLNETDEKDPESTYISVRYSVSENRYDTDSDRFNVTIPYKNRDNEKVQELIGLLENGGSGALDPHFEVRSYFTSTELRVTEKNKDRVLELMTEIALMNIEQ